eukprot:4555240-Pleurochrysis_carterae.AAC.1
MRVGLLEFAKDVFDPYRFLTHLSDAIPGSVAHPLVQYVHDCSGFLSETVYDSVEGMNEAREFILKEHDDGGTCSMHTAHYRLLHEVCAFEICLQQHACECASASMHACQCASA